MTFIRHQLSGDGVEFTVNEACALVLFGPQDFSEGWICDKKDLNFILDKIKPGIEVKIVGPQNLLDLFSHEIQQKGGKVLSLVRRDGRFTVRFYSQNRRFLVSRENNRKTRVMIVDDSPTILRILGKVIQEFSDLEVVAQVSNPREVEKLIDELRPDVVTLDINMPEIDGVTLAGRIAKSSATPTLMVSSISPEEGNQVLNALEAGAFDYLQKPSSGIDREYSEVLREKIILAAASRGRRYQKRNPVLPSALQGVSEGLVAIGSSTGGTEALREIFAAFPKQIPAIVVIQHIPAHFSRAFAERMDRLFDFRVKEAEDGDIIVPNQVLVAPGGRQMAFYRDGAQLRVRITDDPPVNRHKPSVDYSFDSLLACRPEKLVGVILTGMGGDGAKGLLKIRQAGFHTIGQNEASCVVYGMPRVAKELGAVAEEVDLHLIPEAILRACSKSKNLKSA
ncbi:MAG: chemotaxis response regulator protein-glutamate methylesterase [Bdellovibrionaceae bacterium]|nr:chemotaxis response regulator protein-glutamate methylesterase [Pseudobdellovibrionaceae bacterium]